MKKSLISLAILGAMSSAAFAQTNVTIYGLVDAGIAVERGGAAGSVTKLTSGIGGQSRLGFKGTEDLGGGLAAVFQLETGFRADDGSLDSANTIFNRQAFIGLSSKEAGTLTLGRQYTMYYNALAQVGDPFGGNYAGTAKNLFPTVGAQVRASNAVVYATPSMSGFSGEGMYSLGEQSGNGSAGRQFGLGLNFSNGPLNARLVYNNRNSDVAANNTVTPAVAFVSHDIGRNTMFAANYDFSVVKAYFAYGTDKGFNSAALASANAFNYTVAPKASTDSSDLLLGVQVPVDPSNILMASYIRKDDKTGFNQDADQWALGISHLLSKRTSAYVAYARIKNKNGAGYTVGNNNEVGTGDKAFNVGLHHSF